MAHTSTSILDTKEPPDQADALRKLAGKPPEPNTRLDDPALFLALLSDAWHAGHIDARLRALVAMAGMYGIASERVYDELRKGARR
jgi:hypothetical protein